MSRGGTAPRLGLIALLVLATAADASAERVTVAMHDAPPYVIIHADGTVTGIEHDLIAAALTHAGRDLHPLVMPYARIRFAYVSDPSIDAEAPAVAAFNLPGMLTQPFIRFRNVARALARSHLQIASIASLRGLRIQAFQNARDALGPAYATVVAEPPTEYQEQTNQMLQLRALWAGHADVMIGDRRILDYYQHLPQTEIDPTEPTIDYPLFPPTDYSVAFHDAQLAEAFDRGIAAIRADGSYDRILAQYEPR